MDFSQFLLQNPDAVTVQELQARASVIEPKPVKDITKNEISKKEVTKKQISKKEVTKKQISKKEVTKNDVPKKQITKNCPKQKNINVKSFFNQNNIPINQDDEQQLDFKKGDLVIIKYMPNSMLNVYKGYYGEIKEYIPREESAYIILEAMNHPRRIKFPLGHFMYRNHL
jgi:hypothetical protein